MSIKLLIAFSYYPTHSCMIYSDTVLFLVLMIYLSVLLEVCQFYRSFQRSYSFSLIPPPLSLISLNPAPDSFLPSAHFGFILSSFEAGTLGKLALFLMRALSILNFSQYDFSCISQVLIFFSIFIQFCVF